MKPKDLKPVFKWVDRRPLIEDRVLYVPNYYFEHSKFSMPKFSEIFENKNPIHVEYCSGNGDWILERAKKHPEINWIAVEMQFERVRKIWSKRENYQINNLLIVCGEAETLTKYYLPDDCIDSVYINFPDPWPKEKHAKNRLLKEPFIELLASKMKDFTPLTFVTDDVDYKEEVLNKLIENPHFQPQFEPPYYVTELENYGGSYFYDLWVSKQKTIHYLIFNNQKTVKTCLN